MPTYRELEVNGKKIWTNLATGEVTGVKRWSDTHVSSSGGGGYVDPKYGGYVRSAQVSSTITQNLEFWIKESDGKEVDYEGSGSSLRVNDGHKVKLLWGAPKGVDKGKYLVFENETSGTTHTFVNWLNWCEDNKLLVRPNGHNLALKIIPKIIALATTAGLLFYIFLLAKASCLRKCDNEDFINVIVTMLRKDPSQVLFSLGTILVVYFVIYLLAKFIVWLFLPSNWKEKQTNIIKNKILESLN